MSNSILKFELSLADVLPISVPLKRWLAVDVHKGVPMIWAEVNLEVPVEFHTLYIRRTGAVMTGEEGDFLGLFVVADLVYHVFAHISDSPKLLAKF